MKRLYTIFLLSLAGLLMLASCATDDLSVNPSADGMVDIRLTLGIGDASSTRTGSTATATERQVDYVHILVFKSSDDGSGKLISVERGMGVTEDPSSNGKILTMTTRVEPNEKYDFLVLANAYDILSAANLNPEVTTYDAAMEALTTKRTALTLPWIQKIPMCGTATCSVAEQPVSLDIDLYRMLAKVEVKLATAVKKDDLFTITSVYHCNYVNEGMLIYNQNLMDDDKPTLPVSPGTIVAETEYDFSNAPSFYIFEDKAVTVEPDHDDWNAAHCLVVKGKYKDLSEETYYRIDFTETDGSGNKKAVPILRNHHYQITIGDVYASGRLTLDDALNSGEATCAYTVADWGKGGVVTFWDKNPQYYCTVNSGEQVEISTSSGKTKDVSVTTNIPGEWTAKLGNGVSLRITSPTTAGSGMTGNQTLKLQTTAANSTTGTVTIYFEDVGVTIKFNVYRK